jgi:hypothetical protein
MDPDNSYEIHAYREVSSQYHHNGTLPDKSDKHLDTAECIVDLLHPLEEGNVKREPEGYNSEDMFCMSNTSSQLLSRINYRTNSII